MSKVANFNHIRDELILIINEWDRPFPLRGIAKVKYSRELLEMRLSETTVQYTLWHKGYEYKHHGKKPPITAMDTEGIIKALNERLTTAVVTSAVQENHKIYLTMEVIE